MEKNARRALVAASVAGLLASLGAFGGGLLQAHEGDHASEGKVPCYGVNKCKGTGECGGKGHGCAGMNACAGQGYIELEKDVCLRIKDGRLTPEAQG
jgi:uncharacterized membrane protein